MRWCLGYLERNEQIAFLKKAHKALGNKPCKYTRNNQPSSFIFVLDNIDDKKDREVPIKIKDQTVQPEEYYSDIFNEAGL